MSLYESFQTVLASVGMKELTHPIFYNAPIGIRFDIGDNGHEVYAEAGAVNPRYVAACLERSSRIYHRLKTTPDLLVIEGYAGEEDTVEGFVSSVVTATDLPQPDEIHSESPRLDDEAIRRVLLFWRLHNFQPHTLLEDVIRAELGGKKAFLTSSVYFVCTKDPMLFHVYDDRGADVVADKQESIQPLYAELQEWVLDYNGKNFDK